ncbi:sensor histidine kinase [Oceanobacillus sp. 1P07AA]|uniref:sensor histidine kinase n=1 Tax=Oceanobacillus sp. 1P07AA TaxID=3132293 RepID=UPI0039A560A6
MLKLKSTRTPCKEEHMINLHVYRIRMVFWIVFIFIAATLLQFLEQVSIIASLVSMLFIVLHIVLYRFSYRFKYKKSAYYFLLQSSIIFITASIMPHGSPVILIGLLPILIAESIIFFGQSFKVFLLVLLLYIPFTVAIAINYGIQELVIFIPVLFSIVGITVFYALLYIKEEKAWMRMEYYIEELETANQTIEELSIKNERKRVARDLHDTLAQGLVGVIMKLEAVDIHLESGNYEKCQSIIKGSMKEARLTLKDAREVIDDLRINSMSESAFVMDVEEEISRFEQATSIQVHKTIEVLPSLTSLIKQHVSYIISECLINIAKHAQASKVEIEIALRNNELIINISDNGRGFNVHSIGEINGHYGLIGIKERVRILNGSIQINSEPKNGTSLKIEIPVEKGAENED